MLNPALSRLRYLAMIPLFVALAIVVSSILVVRFRLAPGLEGGFALWGFPFPAVESGPFYAGWLGETARQGGPAYIRTALGAYADPRIHIPGIIANTLFYASIAATIALASRLPHSIKTNIARYLQGLGRRRAFFLAAALLSAALLDLGSLYVLYLIALSLSHSSGFAP